MDKSYITVLGDGLKKDFQLPFDYLEQDDILVSVNNVILAMGDDYDFTDRYWIKLKVAPAEGVKIKFQRLTDRDRAIATYSNGTVLTADTLNQQTEQTLMITQEAFDSLEGALSVPYGEADYDADNKRIRNLGDAVDDTDAVNKRGVQAVVNSAKPELDAYEDRCKDIELSCKNTFQNMSTTLENATTLAVAKAVSKAKTEADRAEAISDGVQSKVDGAINSSIGTAMITVNAKVNEAKGYADQTKTIFDNATIYVDNQVNGAISTCNAKALEATNQANRAEEEANRAENSAHNAASNVVLELNAIKANVQMNADVAEDAMEEAVLAKDTAISESIKAKNSADHAQFLSDNLGLTITGEISVALDAVTQNIVNTCQSKANECEAFSTHMDQVSAETIAECDGYADNARHSAQDAENEAIRAKSEADRAENIANTTSDIVIGEVTTLRDEVQGLASNVLANKQSVDINTALSYEYKNSAKDEADRASGLVSNVQSQINDAIDTALTNTTATLRAEAKSYADSAKEQADIAIDTVADLQEYVDVQVNGAISTATNEANRATTEANRAKSEADRAQVQANNSASNVVDELSGIRNQVITNANLASGYKDQAEIFKNTASGEADRAYTEANRASSEAGTAQNASVLAQQHAVSASGVPLGTLCYFPKDSSYPGFLRCNGGPVMKTYYPLLVEYLNPGQTMALLPNIPVNADGHYAYIKAYAQTAPEGGGTGGDTGGGTITATDYKIPQSIIRGQKHSFKYPHNVSYKPNFLSYLGLEVTLHASVVDPFEVAFGTPNGVETGLALANMNITLPSYDGTYHIYVEQADGGGLTLGYTNALPCYSVEHYGYHVIPSHTGPSSSFGVASASNEVVGSEAYKAFQAGAGTDSTREDTGWKTTTMNATLKYVFNVPTLLSECLFWANSSQAHGRAPKEFTIWISENDDVPDTMVAEITDFNQFAYWRSYSVTEFVGCKLPEPKLVKSVEFRFTKNQANDDSKGLLIHDIRLLVNGGHYNPASKEFKYNGNAVKRVFIGKVVVYGATGSSVMCYHFGDFCYLPINNGNLCSQAIIYLENNPFGAPVQVIECEGYASNVNYTSNVQDWIKVITGSNYGMSDSVVNEDTIKFYGYSYVTQNAIESKNMPQTVMRALIKRAF